MDKVINSIVKFIKNMYHPENITVDKKDNRGEYIIDVFFYDIDDKYIRNPRAHSIAVHKESMMERDIRSEVYNYFRVKTSGLQPPNFYSPYEHHGITIDVHLITKP